MSDTDGKDLGPIKIIKVERDTSGLIKTQFRDFKNSTANVTYEDADGKQQTAIMNVSSLFDKISAGPGNFVIPVDEEK